MHLELLRCGSGTSCTLGKAPSYVTDWQGVREWQSVLVLRLAVENNTKISPSLKLLGHPPRSPFRGAVKTLVHVNFC